MNEKLYFTSQKKLKWFCLKTFEYEEYVDQSPITLLSCIHLADGNVLISGTIEQKQGVMNHMMFFFDSVNLSVRREPRLGMTDLHFVNVGSDVYYVSGNKCERYCLITHTFFQLEHLTHSHIQAGCCKYLEGVLVVSGINCQYLEFYEPSRDFWVQISALPMSLFEISCVQIGDDEILCINKKRTYRVNVETGECICTQTCKMDIAVVPVVRGEYVFSLNHQHQLARYSLSEDKWNVLTRSGCCILQ